MDISKVVYGDTTLIDLTEDTVTADSMLLGVTAHGSNGEQIYGTMSQVTPATAAPLMDGTAAVGASIKYAREDHVHPHDSSIPTKVSDLTNDSGFIAAPSANVDEVIAYNGTTWVADKRMVILSYGSSTWTDFINAYNSNAVIYCRASSNSNPATGNQGRMAFMAYVGYSGSTVTNVEFQYYRSVSTHSASQQGDQVFIYKLESTNGGKWTVTTREASSKIVAGTGLDSSYSNGTITMSLDSGYGIPSGGTTGQVLAKKTDTDRDLEWVNQSGGGQFLVTITSSGSTFSSDKTVDEILAAVAAGKEVIATYNSKIYQLAYYSPNNAYPGVYFANADYSGTFACKVERFYIYKKNDAVKIEYSAAVVATTILPEPLDRNAVIQVEYSSNDQKYFVRYSALDDMGTFFDREADITITCYYLTRNQYASLDTVQAYQFSNAYTTWEYNEDYGDYDTKGHLVFKRHDIVSGSLVEKSLTVSQFQLVYDNLDTATVTYSEVPIVSSMTTAEIATAVQSGWI